MWEYQVCYMSVSKGTSSCILLVWCRESVISHVRNEPSHGKGSWNTLHTLLRCSRTGLDWWRRLDTHTTDMHYIVFREVKCLTWTVRNNCLVSKWWRFILILLLLLLHNSQYENKDTLDQGRPIQRLFSNSATLPNAVHQWHHAFYPCVGKAINKHNKQNAQQDHNRQSSITLGLVCESTVGYGTYHAGSRP